MQPDSPNAEPRSTALEALSRRVDRSYRVMTWLIILLVATALVFLKLRENRRAREAWALNALASLPAALTEVPLPLGREAPADRLHMACALLSAALKVPVGELESGMSRMANRIIIETAEREDVWDERERAGAYLLSFYLLPDPEDPATLKLREDHAESALGKNRQGERLKSEAEVELRAVLAMRRAVQGEDHAETLHTWLLVAASIFHQGGRGLEAATECREVLAHYERHPVLAGERGPRELMARILRVAELYGDEEPMRRWLFADTVREHGINSLEAAEVQFTLAQCLQALGKNDEAAKQAQEAKTVFKKAGTQYQQRSAEAFLKKLTL